MLEYLDTHLQTNILNMFQCHFNAFSARECYEFFSKNNQSQAASTLTSLNIHELCTDAETFKLGSEVSILSWLREKIKTIADIYGDISIKTVQVVDLMPISVKKALRPTPSIQLTKKT